MSAMAFPSGDGAAPQDRPAFCPGRLRLWRACPVADDIYDQINAASAEIGNCRRLARAG
jgi:hypothetical protein